MKIKDKFKKIVSSVKFSNLPSAKGRAENDTNDSNVDKKSDSGLGTTMLARLAIGVVVVVALFICVSSIMQYNKLQQEKSDLEAQRDKLEAEIEENRALLDAPMDREYVVRIAKEKLGLRFPDEIVYYNDMNK